MLQWSWRHLLRAKHQALTVGLNSQTRKLSNPKMSIIHRFWENNRDNALVLLIYFSSQTNCWRFRPSRKSNVSMLFIKAQINGWNLGSDPGCFPQGWWVLPYVIGCKKNNEWKNKWLQSRTWHRLQHVALGRCSLWQSVKMISMKGFLLSQSDTCLIRCGCYKWTWLHFNTPHCTPFKPQQSSTPCSFR